MGIKLKVLNIWMSKGLYKKKLFKTGGESGWRLWHAFIMLVI